jgi:hypothetical protein
MGAEMSIARKFTDSTREKYEVLYSYIKRKYEETPEAQDYVKKNYKCHKSYFYFPSYNDWAWDFGREFLYDFHHGAEFEIMSRPQYYFELYQEEIVKTYINVYSRFLPNQIAAGTIDELVEIVTNLSEYTLDRAKKDLESGTQMVDRGHALIKRAADFLVVQK